MVVAIIFIERSAVVLNCAPRVATAIVYKIPFHDAAIVNLTGCLTRGNFPSVGHPHLAMV